MISHFLTAYLFCALLIAAGLVALTQGWIPGLRGTPTVRRDDGKLVPPWQAAALLAGIVLLWPVTLVLLYLQHRGNGGDPPGPPAMGGT